MLYLCPHCETHARKGFKSALLKEIKITGVTLPNIILMRQYCGEVTDRGLGVLSCCPPGSGGEMEVYSEKEPESGCWVRG